MQSVWKVHFGDGEENVFYSSNRWTCRNRQRNYGKQIVKKYNLVNIDTGATYRCVTLEMMNQNIGMDEEEKIAEMLKSIQIELITEKGKQKVFLNGQDVTEKIRSKEVSANVSPVSSIKQVRLAMGGLQRKMAQGKDVIMEGRDIGTVIFPNADVKIYLDANVEVRAKRRVKQNEEKGIEMSYEEVLENIKKRDKNDMEKEMGALKVAEDAVVIDGSEMTIKEVEKAISNVIDKKLKAKKNKKNILGETRNNMEENRKSDYKSNFTCFLQGCVQNRKNK